MAHSRRSQETSETPSLYAMVQTGLESIAADEITRDLGGEVKKVARGIVVFQLDEVTPDILKLRTTEDVFLLGWGSSTLTYRTGDVDNFRKWTANKPDWKNLFRIHHSIRPKTKGKPTFRLVCQMQGDHAYKRYDARHALATGLSKVIPTGWLPADENAWLEVWLTIRGKTAVCGLRLTDKTMRHRTYKEEHVLASLRPTVAAAMVRLAGIGPGMTILDPMCGAGTIAAEAISVARSRRGEKVTVIMGDIDPNAVFVATQNLEHVGPVYPARWDARRLPLPDASIDRIVTNPPFGKQLSNLQEVPPLYAAIVAEWNRVVKPGGRGVFLVMEQDALEGPLKSYGWKATQRLKVRVLGQLAILSVWRKPEDDMRETE